MWNLKNSFVVYGKIAEYLKEKYEYSEAVKVGFITIEEHKKAKSLGLDTKEQYEKYISVQDKNKSLKNI